MKKGMTMNKRAISTVISVVLLILLVLAAIGILWAVVNAFINEGTSGIEGSADCLTNTFEIEDFDTDADTVSVRRVAGDADALDIQLSLIINGNTQESTCVIPSIGEYKLCTLTSYDLVSSDEVDLVATVNAKNCGVADSATAP